MGNFLKVEDHLFIRNNYLVMTDREIAEHLNRSAGTIKNIRLKENLKKPEGEGKFKSGHSSKLKGKVPVNKKPDGTVSIHDGIKHIKISGEWYSVKYFERCVQGLKDFLEKDVQMTYDLLEDGELHINKYREKIQHEIEAFEEFLETLK